MLSDGDFLCGLFFEGSRDSKNFRTEPEKIKKDALPVFEETRRRLNLYFSGRPPKDLPPYHIAGLTPFRRQVTECMLRIPFGQTVSCGDIAREMAMQKGAAHMSVQAVGGAVGFNPICILIPCHRVIGANGAMTGYGGGLSNKICLLEFEKSVLTQAREYEVTPASYFSVV